MVGVTEPDPTASLIDELLDGEGYRLVRTRIESAIEKLRDDLEREGQTEARTNYVRGQIYGLRLALMIPRNLINELEGPNGKRK